MEGCMALEITRKKEVISNILDNFSTGRSKAMDHCIQNRGH
jgi:hypothetical protein